MNEDAAPAPGARLASERDDWSALAAALAPHLAQAAGAGAHPVSIALDLAGALVGPDGLACQAWVERATRTLVFLGAEARTADGALAASATAVFRRT